MAQAPYRSPVPTSEAIVHEIIRSLEAGDLAPGERLVEADLCLRFGAGRQAVREALQHLKAMGVVEIVPNRGAHVVAVSRDRAVMTLEVTELLFGLVARTAARRVAAGASSAAIERVVAELDACTTGGSAESYMSARRHLFAALAEVAGNSELTRILQQVRVHALRGQFGFAGFRAEHAAELAAIGRLVLSGEGASAEAASRAYVERIRQHLEAL